MQGDAFGAGTFATMSLHDDGRSIICESSLPEQVPWCAVPTAGLQLGPAPSVLEEPNSTISLAISLLTSSTTTSSPASAASSMSMSTSSAGTAGLKHILSRMDSTQQYNSAGSVLCCFKATPVPFNSSVEDSAAHCQGIMPLKRLKLASTGLSGETDLPSAQHTGSGRSSSSSACPPAPRRPRAPVMLVPLSELGLHVHSRGLQHCM